MKNVCAVLGELSCVIEIYVDVRAFLSVSAEGARLEWPVICPSKSLHSPSFTLFHINISADVSVLALSGLPECLCLTPPTQYEF